METVASSAVCMRGRHRHRSSGVTVGCVRPWVYQPGYRISLPHFFPRPTILSPLHSLVFLLSFEASGCHDFRLAGQQRRGGNPRCHGDCPLGYTLDNMAADVPTRSTACASFPLPYPRQGSARGCFCTGGGGGENTPAVARNPHGGMARIPRPRTLERARVPLTRLAVSTIPLRARLSPVPELCKCVGILQPSS